MKRATARGDGEIGLPERLKIKTFPENPFICWNKQNSYDCQVMYFQMHAKIRLHLAGTLYSLLEEDL